MSGPWEDFKPTADGPWNDFKKPDVSTAETFADVGEHTVRGFNKGLVGLITAPYRAVDWVGEKLTGGDFLPNAEDMPLYKPFLKQPEAKTTPGKFAHAAGEVVGSSVIPELGMLTKAQQLPAVAPSLPGMADKVLRPYLESPGMAIGADALAATGAGAAQEAAKEGGFGPVGQTVAGVAGGLTPLGVTGVATGYRALQSARASASPYERVAKGLGDTSVDDLANAVAVGNTPANLGISRHALDVLGEEMVNAGGNRRAAIPATLARLQAAGASPTAAKDQLRRIMGAHADSDLLLGEYPAAAQSDLDTRLARNIANVSDEEAGALKDSGTQRLIDYVANTGSMASSQNVRNAIGARAQTLKDSTEDVIRGMAPGRKTIQDVDTMLDAAAKSASTEYERIHDPANNLVDTQRLTGGLQAVVDKYANVARTRGGEARDALENALREFFIDYNGQPLILPNMQMAQDMRGALRGMIKRERIAGNDHLVNTLEPMYRDVTTIMRDASPAWSKVNDRWADMSLKETAQDLGESFANRAGPKFREQLQDFKKLAPEAQDIVRIHFTQQLLDMIENAAKLGGTKNLGELFTKAHTRNMVREILGDAPAMQMARLIRDANIMARSRDMLKGSPTQPRHQMQKEQDSDLNMIAAADNFDWRSWKAALLEKAVALMRERRNKTIGKVVTTPMHDIPAVAESLERMRQARAIAERYARPLRRQPGYTGQFGGILREVEGQ